MPVRYCQRHGIGFNTDLEAVCPQCTLSRQEPAPTVDAATHDRAAKEEQLRQLQLELGVIPAA